MPEEQCNLVPIFTVFFFLFIFNVNYLIDKNIVTFYYRINVILFQSVQMSFLIRHKKEKF